MKKVCITIFLTFICGISICPAQQDSSANPSEKKVKLISESNSPVANGEIEIKGYRLEQVELDASEKNFRLVIVTAKPLPVGAYRILYDENLIGAYVIKSDEVAILINDKTLTNGSRIGLSKIGSGRNGRLILPATLSVPSEYATPAAEIEARRIVIKLQRTSSKYQPIELSIENFFRAGKSSMTCGFMTVRNNPITVKIDNKVFNTGCADDDTIIVRFSNEEFKELKDGAEINFGSGFEVSDENGRIVGLLDKNSLQ